MKKSSIIAGVIVTIATALSLKSNLVYAADSIPAITAGTSGLPRMDVVDVSSNNGNISVASFQKMHQYGVGAVIVKLTEATSYRNPYAATQIANAKAAGLKIGAYHYSWYTSQSSAQSEAKYFTDYAKSLKLPSDTLMVDDLEDTYTMTNNVTNNAKAFNTQVKATGFSNTSTYTGLYYKNTTGLNFSYIGNNRAWIAQYPFAPSSNSLWNTTYGMWQWNSNTSFPGVSGTFDVSIDYTNLVSGKTGYYNNIFYWRGTPASGYFDDGTGYKWFENGYLYTGFRFYMGTYYYFDDGLRRENAWATEWGNKYYLDSNGRAVQEIQNIQGVRYYFGSNNTFYLRINTLVSGVNDQIYDASGDGILRPWTGYIYDGNSANGGYRWYQDGQLYSGFRYYMGTYYWFVNGVRQNEGWRYAWNYTYWTDHNGRAVQGWQLVNGKRYNFGNDGTYYMR